MPHQVHHYEEEDEEEEEVAGEEPEEGEPEDEQEGGEEEEEEEEEEEDEEDDDEKTAGADEEEEEEEDEDGDDQTTAAKPMTEDADREELYQAGILAGKHLMAQAHNEHSDDNAVLSHQDIDDDLLDQHEDDDWRVQILKSEDENGQPFSLEAKMDTGADQNFISLEAADAHGLLVEDIEGPEPAFKVGSGENTGVDGIVRLSYSAGDPSTRYTEEFYAKEGLAHDVVLGMPFLMHSHALTINPQFAHQKPDGDFLLFETQPATKESKVKHANFAAQKRAEREAALNLRTTEK